ncbi:MAG: Hsp70 family protein [Alphaproteobacteria bacterium]|nr:Hsp70 family protein [Alphaproteobacteria bacterium]MCB9693565.1 Hsp70 family protein [Alphaproteobacteria bacterium]
MVGIDLGTTFSLVSILQDGVPTVLPNAAGEHLTASAVSLLDNGEVLVGPPARARLTTHPGRTAIAFKRDMGSDKRVDLGLRSFTPVELSAMVLKVLKRDAEAALGRPVHEAVITVPAYFGEVQRQATKQAGEIAGLKVERIINEPTAAAMAYGLHEKDREVQAVVLDLGGGTFDVTVLEIIEGVIEIQSSAGDARLGGEDFVDLLATHVAGRIQEEHRVDPRDDPRAFARIREACEAAKKRLTLSPNTRIVAPALTLGGRSVDVDLEITRDDAEAVWAPLLDRIRAPIHRALRDASLEPEKIDEIILVGGATRMPCFVRLAASLFGKMPRRTLPPDEAVAMGAAVQAALKSGDTSVEDIVVTDVAPFTLGISTTTSMGRQRIAGIFAPIIDRGSVIPTSRTKAFYTVEDLQTALTIQVYQGEHPMCRDNTKLGEYTMRDMPAKQAGEQGVDVRFTYDLNGLLEVEMAVMGTDRREHLVIEQAPGRLSADQIAEARAAMEKLKFHPRDALPNTTAIQRAEALYVELTGDARDHLGTTLALFRAALETEDKEEIEVRRTLLNQILNTYAH